jgi:hypothetical protein
MPHTYGEILHLCQDLRRGRVGLAQYQGVCCTTQVAAVTGSTSPEHLHPSRTQK